MAYYLMAKDAGINMMPSRLVEIEGTQNFLTQRFDRVEGRKIYTQTLAAMSSLVDTYEDLFVVGRKLNLSAEEQSQQYRRMVFNVLAENVDDHTKNFSFVMYPNGECIYRQLTTSCFPPIQIRISIVTMNLRFLASERI